MVKKDWRLTRRGLKTEDTRNEQHPKNVAKLFVDLTSCMALSYFWDIYSTLISVSFCGGGVTENGQNLGRLD